MRTIDLEPRHIDGVVVRSRFSGEGTDDLTILGDHKATSLWTEANAASQLDWEFRNRYWVDPRSGYVWKSVQYLSPQLPALEIIVYKPAINT